MYGKHFASMYKGSMFGAGVEVFAVWGYVIANTVKSQVELNPAYLAAVLGSTPDEIAQAIEFLCSPDANSRSKNDDGRRLIREGEFAYQVPNHESYRAIRSEDDRREYNRIKQAESRKRKREMSKGVNTRVNDCQSMSAHTEAEADLEEEESTNNVDLVEAHVVENASPQAARPLTRTKRGTLIPRPFNLTNEMREWAKERRPTVDVLEETEKFVNHFRSTTGRNATKKDWRLTWNNWILNARGNNGQNTNTHTERTRRAVDERNRREQIRRELDSE